MTTYVRFYIGMYLQILLLLGLLPERNCDNKNPPKKLISQQKPTFC